MKTWILVALLVVSMVGVGVTVALTTGSADSAEATMALETVEASTEIADLSFPGIASASFTGTWCYISCADGTSTAVRTFSTHSCCSACADFCGTACATSGAGPAVLCDDVFN